MIQLVYLDDPNEPIYQEYIERTLKMVYACKVVPEQNLIPYEVTLDKIRRNYRDCSIVSVEDTVEDTILLVLLCYGQESPHVVGDVAVCAITVGNTNNPKLGIMLMRSIKRIAKASGHSWLKVHHRLAPYTYRAKYYKV